MNQKELILKILKKNKEITSPQLAKSLKLSRQQVALYLRELLLENKIQKKGSTKNSVYFFPKNKKSILTNEGKIELKLILNTKELQEDYVFEDIQKKLSLKKSLSKQANSIAYYSFCEMLNNAIDHSKSKKVNILVKIDRGTFSFEIRDQGVGIFKNVQNIFKLDNELQAISHVLKGKQTTWPEAHSGQGIFFTSKIADQFSIKSHNNELIFENKKDDVAFKENKFFRGTLVKFSIKKKTRKDLEKLFREYADEDFEFDRNIIKFKHRNESELISRSQARRLLYGLEKYNNLTFDFQGVNSIGQAYADEVFRVYQSRHPEKIISWINANKTIDFMIKRAIKESA